MKEIRGKRELKEIENESILKKILLKFKNACEALPHVMYFHMVDKSRKIKVN